MRHFHLGIGDGAFRESNFAELFSTATDIIKQSLYGNVGRGLIESPWDQTQKTNKPLQTIVVDPKELADITEYSFTLWFRPSLAYPKRVGFPVFRHQWTGIAGISEVDNYGAAVNGGRTLSVFYTPYVHQGKNLAGFHYTTYSLAPRNWNIWKDVRFANNENEGQWSFLYFGYSSKTKTAFSYTKHLATGRVQILSWDKVSHNIPPKQLKFYLGAPNRGMLAANGAYFDPSFFIKDGAYLADAAAVEGYLKRNKLPPTIDSGIHQINLVDSAKFFNSAFKSDAIRKEYPIEYNGAKAYSVWGWFKWTQPKAWHTWHNLVRISTNEPTWQKDLSNIGDRTLAIWLHRGYLHFATYSFNLNGRFPKNLWKNFAFTDNRKTNEMKDQWVFFYFGQSKKTNTAVGYVKFPNREHRQVWTEAQHFIPKHFTVNIGGDQIYKGFNGEMKYVRFCVGENE